MMQRSIFTLLLAMFALAVPAQETPGAEREVAGIVFVWCPAGTFQMGSPLDAASLARQFGGRPEWYADELPSRSLEVAGFWLSRTEITQGQWQAVMNTTPWSGHVGDAPDHPATMLTWEDAQSFAREFGKRHDCVARLPNEPEWEYACRGGGAGIFPFGDDSAQLHLHAQFRLNAAGTVQPVAQRGPNGWGLHDMLGNVWEWCQDKYTAGSGRMASGNASVRIIRGGAANSTAAQLRSSFRAGLPIDTRSPRLGMRLVLEP